MIVITDERIITQLKARADAEQRTVEQVVLELLNRSAHLSEETKAGNLPEQSEPRDHLPPGSLARLAFLARRHGFSSGDPLAAEKSRALYEEHLTRKYESLKDDPGE